MFAGIAEYCQIEVTQGQIARVSPEDFEWLSQWKWQAQWAKGPNSFYVIRGEQTEGGYRIIPMHRQILGLEYGDKRFGDHVNCNTLDNRRSNLRIASRAENMRNRRINLSSISGFKGVHWEESAKKWRTRIKVNGKSLSLGLFADPELAHAAYCAAARKHYGEFARIA